MGTALYRVAIWALIAIILSVSHGGLAAVPPAGDDVFGMYADNNFNDDPSDENPPWVDPAYGLVTVYVYLTNVTGPAIGAYEFALSYTGGLAPVVVDAGLPPQGVNFGSDNEYIVGVGTALLPDQYGHAILMSPTYFVVDTEWVNVYVGPTSIPTVPDQISYVEYDDPSIIHAMNPASGSFGMRIFSFNDGGCPAVECVTWTDVKIAYRQ